MLTPEERREIAQRTVRARWIKAGKLKEIALEEPESPEVRPGEAILAKPTIPHSLMKGHLSIGDLELEAHVLSDHRRVLTQREVVRVLSGGPQWQHPGYLDRNPLTKGKFDQYPKVQFSIPGTRTVATGYEATVLVEICDMYLQAREGGFLKDNQLKLAAQAEIVMRA